ncbi:MAG: hypothetical protein WC372_12620 [Candidatus Neomarinimicrobiota bacterium]|jgi:hypothetical protein
MKKMYHSKQYNYKNPKPSDCTWNKGFKYDVGLANNMLYTNNSGSRGKVTVFIRDNKTKQIHTRTGDAQQVGNFCPVWINWEGEKIIAHDLLKVRR